MSMQVMKIAPKLIDAMLDLHGTVVANFQPSTGKMHSVAGCFPQLFGVTQLNTIPCILTS
jgi:hypothetical protein